MNCDNCAYKGICKFEDDARKFEEVVMKFIMENKDAMKPNHLNILINCTKFKKKYGSKEEGIR